MGNGEVVQTRFLAVQGVVPHELRFPVRGVAEHLLADGVAEGPDVLLRGLEVLVHHDIAPLVRFDARVLDFQDVRIGLPACCYEQVLRRGPEFLAALAVPADDGDAGAVLPHLHGLGVCVYRHAAAEGRLEKLRDLGLFLGHEPLVALEDGDLRAHGVEKVGELHGNVAAADDDHALGPLPELERALIGKVRHGLDALDGRDERPCAGDEEDGLPLELFSRYFEGIVAGEAGLAPVKIELLGLPHRLLHAVVAFLDRTAHTLHDGGEVDLRYLGRNAEPFRLPDLHDSIRRIDEDLGGYSAHIKAGPSHGPLVHEGQGLVVGQGVLDEVRSGPGADDDDVVFLHDSPPVASSLMGKARWG